MTIAEQRMAAYLSEAADTAIYLIDSIWAEPHDPVNRLIYSDWVEEQDGDSARAALIRERVGREPYVQCPTCNGRGWTPNQDGLHTVVHDLDADAEIDCFRCGGTGKFMLTPSVPWLLGFGA